jgi:hypothetical protein
MKIWTGIFCRFLTFITLVVAVAFAVGCTTTSRSSDSPEVSLKADQAKVDELRKNIPDEVKKSNDRLGDMLRRWKDSQMEPEKLRDRFSDEIRKSRLEIEKRHHRERDDFNRAQKDKRRDFQDKQKDDRDHFLSSKHDSEKRSEYMNRLSEDRDRFNSDIHDERDEFEDRIREERKNFESDIADRWSEFRNEFPEYVKEYSEKKEAKEKQRDKVRSGDLPENPQSMPTQQRQVPHDSDVNQGGNGWPATDPSDVNH